MGEHHKDGIRRAKAVKAGHPEWVDYPRTRPRAVKAGAAFFFTGRLCLNRHIALRRVELSRCVDCEGPPDNLSAFLAEMGLD